MFFSRYLDSHWLLIDSNRNYPADVVGSRYNLFFSSSHHRHSLCRCPFPLFIVFFPSCVSSFGQNTDIFLAVATRSSRDQRDILPTCIHRTLVERTRVYAYPRYTSLSKESGVSVDRRSRKINNFLNESMSNMFNFE